MLALRALRSHRQSTSMFSHRRSCSKFRCGGGGCGCLPPLSLPLSVWAGAKSREGGRGETGPGSKGKGKGEGGGEPGERDGRRTYRPLCARWKKATAKTVSLSSGSVCTLCCSPKTATTTRYLKILVALPCIYSNAYLTDFVGSLFQILSE